MKQPKLAGKSSKRPFSHAISPTILQFDTMISQAGITDVIAGLEIAQAGIRNLETLQNVPHEPEKPFFSRFRPVILRNILHLGINVFSNQNLTSFIWSVPSFTRTEDLMLALARDQCPLSEKFMPKGGIS